MKQENIILAAIVEKASKGDHDAFLWLYNQYNKAMFNICVRMLTNPGDAQDVFQESFVIAFCKLHQLKAPDQFGGWLKKIVINECIKKCKSSINWDELKEEFTESIPNEEMEWWKTVDIQLIHDEIKKLPNGCRQVFTLFVLEDYTHKQIAENLAISESTSKTQYRRARQLLKERIIKQFQINGQT